LLIIASNNSKKHILPTKAHNVKLRNIHEILLGVCDDYNIKCFTKHTSPTKEKNMLSKIVLTCYWFQNNSFERNPLLIKDSFLWEKWAIVDSASKEVHTHFYMH